MNLVSISQLSPTVRTMSNDDMLTDPTCTAAAEPPAMHHLRTIVHIDIDCFYAQVEELLRPELRTQPVGIRQKGIIVTCNYVARTYGVGKLQQLAKALELCPQLVLVNGEDLTRYRKMSADIFEVLHTFTGNVEKLGMDENYLDVSDLVAQRMAAASGDDSVMAGAKDELQGFQYPRDERLSNCACGCATRLVVGSRLATEIRAKLYAELGITSCAGVAHNKLLAKWVGGRHKPNQQTVFVPGAAAQVMRQLPSLREITGVGEKTEVMLRELGIASVSDLQDAPLLELQRKFGGEMGGKLKEWSFGRDASTVKPSGKPKSISLEDSCRSISVRADVEEKFRLLLIRLIEQVIEDGRIPILIKIIVRKFDGARKSSHRETKQANILPALFRRTGEGKILLTEGGQEKLLKTVMHLFERAVNLSKPFNITLLGLAFAKFQENRKCSRSIANFLIKKSDVEVQSITNLSSEGYSPNTSDVAPRYYTSSPMHMDFESVSDTSHASCSSDVSESEFEPSPKKTRIGYLMAKRRCFMPGGESSSDKSSPSKLRVSDLRLNSRDQELFASKSAPISPIAQNVFCATSPSAASSLSLVDTLNNISVDSSTSSSSLGKDITDIPIADCPPSVDPTVFRELPADVQQELLTQWRSAAAAESSTPVQRVASPLSTAIASTNASAASTSSTKTHSPSTAATASSSSKANTLHRYFIAHSQQ